MGRACVCCGDECLDDIVYLHSDRYAASVRSFVETRVDTYELKGALDDSSYFVPTSIEIISTESENTTDNKPFLANTFRSSKISNDYVVVNDERLYTEIWEKTTVIRKLALGFDVDDVFDWEKENKYGIKFIDSIYFRLGNYPKKDMGNGSWSADSTNDETTTSAFFGIFNEDLPASISVFNNLLSEADYQFDITGMSSHAAVDVDSFFERGNTKYLILLTSPDREVKDGFLDQEPDGSGQYKNYWNSINDTKPGSLVGLGDWTDEVENTIWLELIRPLSKDAASSQVDLDEEVLNWITDISNIEYDWHDCFKRIADGEYESTCKYMDVYFDFSVFDDIYFQEGSKLEIELFKPKTSNTKLGARKTEVQLLYELTLVDNVIEEVSNNIEVAPYRTEDGIEYRFKTGDTNLDCDDDSYSEGETLPISEWVDWKTVKIEEDCTKELAGEIPELTTCYNDNQRNTYQLKNKELFEWNLKYSIDGTKDLIMAQYRNPCDSFDVESQIGCEEVISCGFETYSSNVDNVGNLFIRDCVIETTPGHYENEGVEETDPSFDGSTTNTGNEEEGDNFDYTHYYRVNHPIHGSYEPLNIRLQLIDQQYYPSPFSVNGVKNTRTGNNPSCPVVECVGGPATLEWELVTEEFLDLSNNVTFEKHDTTIYGYSNSCITRIVASKKRKENVGGSINRNAYSSSTTTKYIPSSGEAWSIQGMQALAACLDIGTGSNWASRGWYGAIAGDNDYCASPGGTACGTGGIGTSGAFAGSWGTSTPCFDACSSYSSYCNWSSYPSIIEDFSSGEYYKKVGVGRITESPTRYTEFGHTAYITSVPADTTRHFIFDAFIHEEYLLEEYDNITDWDNDLEMATVHSISVTEEPFVYSDTFDDVFTSYYDSNVREIILRRILFLGGPGDGYIPGEGIRFRLQAEFLTCEYPENFSTFSDFDPKYQSYAPVITQDAQLDEDQVGEIAGYLTDFDYWYQIKGTIFIEDEEGEDLSEDDEGNIIVGTYVTDKWFYIDGSGNINGPFDESGFIETLPDFAVYDEVTLYWDGLDRAVVAESVNSLGHFYAGGVDSEYMLDYYSGYYYYTTSVEDERCHTVVDGSSHVYESQFPDDITTECFLPKVDVEARTFINRQSECRTGNWLTGISCVYGSTSEWEKIADSWFTSEPGVEESTRTITESFTGADYGLFSHRVDWNIAEVGDYCGIGLLGCNWTNFAWYNWFEKFCRCSTAFFNENSTSGSESLDIGETLDLSFEIPVASNVIPDESWDYKYTKGDSVNFNEGFTVQTTGFVIPQSSGTHYYKKTVPRFSCDNLPELSFTGDDLLFTCENESSIGDMDRNLGVSHMYKRPLPYINVLKNCSWDLTSKYGINKLGRFDEWEDIIADLEYILASVEWDALNNATSGLYSEGYFGGISGCTDYCYGQYRVEEEGDIDDSNFQVENYGKDLTYEEAFEKIRLDDRFSNIWSEGVGGRRRFDTHLASYQSGYNFCHFARGIYSDQGRWKPYSSYNGNYYPRYDLFDTHNSCRFGCDPVDWYTSCPYVRPSNKLPGDEYDIWSDDYIGTLSKGCGEDKNGLFDYKSIPTNYYYLDSNGILHHNRTDNFGAPSVLSPWSYWGYWDWYYGYYDYYSCSNYSQLNKYEKVDNKDYSFTIKGKNSVEE